MTDFLGTPEGPDWLHDAINSLICGGDVTAPRAHGKSVALVTPQSLWEALAEHLGPKEHIAPLLTDNREYPIERMICEVIADGRRARGLIYDLAIAALGKPKGNRPTAHSSHPPSAPPSCCTAPLPPTCPNKETPCRSILGLTPPGVLLRPHRCHTSAAAHSNA